MRCPAVVYTLKIDNSSVINKLIKTEALKFGFLQRKGQGVHTLSEDIKIALWNEIIGIKRK